MTAPTRDFKFHSRCCSLLTFFILRSLFDHWTQNLCRTKLARSLCHFVELVWKWAKLLVQKSVYRLARV